MRECRAWTYMEQGIALVLTGFVGEAAAVASDGFPEILHCTAPRSYSVLAAMQTCGNDRQLLKPHQPLQRTTLGIRAKQSLVWASARFAQ